MSASNEPVHVGPQRATQAVRLLLTRLRSAMESTHVALDEGLSLAIEWQCGKGRKHLTLSQMTWSPSDRQSHGFQAGLRYVGRPGVEASAAAEEFLEACNIARFPSVSRSEPVILELSVAREPQAPSLQVVRASRVAEVR